MLIHNFILSFSQNLLISQSPHKEPFQLFWGFVLSVRPSTLRQAQGPLRSGTEILSIHCMRQRTGAFCLHSFHRALPCAEIYSAFSRLILPIHPVPSYQFSTLHSPSPSLRPPFSLLCFPVSSSFTVVPSCFIVAHSPIRVWLCFG